MAIDKEWIILPFADVCGRTKFMVNEICSNFRGTDLWLYSLAEAGQSFIRTLQMNNGNCSLADLKIKVRHNQNLFNLIITVETLLLPYVQFRGDQDEELLWHPSRN